MLYHQKLTRTEYGMIETFIHRLLNWPFTHANLRLLVVEDDEHLPKKDGIVVQAAGLHLATCTSALDGVWFARPSAPDKDKLPSS